MTHDFHALSWHFGPYGRQDVHLHPCIAHAACKTELVGPGRDCDPKATHVARRLLEGSTWARREREGEVLA